MLNAKTFGLFFDRWKDRLSYQFDKIIRKDIYVQILGLTIVVSFVTLLGGAIIGWGDNIRNLPSNVWWSFLRIVDTGHLGEDKDLSHEIVAFFITLGGLFIFGALVTIMNNAFAQRLEKLKKGRIKVVEYEHTVILGWGSMVFAAIEEIIISFEEENIERKKRKIVILSEKNRDDMYDAVFRYCFSGVGASKKNIDMLGSVICRTGSIESYADLEMVNLSAADRVIILSDETNPNRSLEDARSIKALFNTIQNYQTNVRSKNRKEGTKPPVICLSINNEITANVLEEFQKYHLSYQSKFHLDQENHSLHLSISVSCFPDILGRMIAQIAMHRSLKDVYEDLLSYGGSEIYVHEVSEFQNSVQKELTFNDLYFRVKTGIPIGIISNNEITLNPKDGKESHPLSNDDKVIMINEKDNDNSEKIVLSGEGEIDIAGLIKKTGVLGQGPQKVLVVGEGGKVNSIVEHIGDFLPHGSCISCTSGNVSFVRNNRQIELTRLENMDNLAAQCKLIEDCGIDIDMLVIADDESNSEIHDAQVLVKIAAAKNAGRSRNKEILIVAEFLDPRNAELAKIVDVNIFVVSTKLASFYLVQVSNVPARKEIFDDLLGSGGDDLCIRPLDYYLEKGSIPQTISFEQIMRLTRECGDLAIGYVENKSGNDKVILNPMNYDRTKPLSVEYVHSVVVVGLWWGDKMGK